MVKDTVHVDRCVQALVVHGGRLTQVARGVAEQANVRLCLYLVCFYYVPYVTVIVVVVN